MFTRKPSVTKIGLENAIETLLRDMEPVDPDTEDYAKMVDQLDKLYKLKEVDHKIETGSSVSKDTVLIVGANLLGILIIVGHERAHLVTSKALNFMLKLR